MIFLVLCILSSSVLYLIFKLFEKYGVNLLQAIVVNYLVAGVLGFALANHYNNSVSLQAIISSSWFPFVVLLGFMFISIFNLMGLSSQQSGLAATSIANKMSVVIPVVFGFFYFGEAFSLMKISGIVLAFLALYFTLKRNSTDTKQRKNYVFPLAIFFSSGTLDLLLSYCNGTFISSNNNVVFTASIFSMAACFGLIGLAYKVVKGGVKFQFKNIVGGIALGIPNFFSIWLMFLGLESTGWPTTVFFPVNNVGVVLATALLGVVFFREKLSLLNYTGIALAVVAILLISL